MTVAAIALVALLQTVAHGPSNLLQDPPGAQGAAVWSRSGQATIEEFAGRRRFVLRNGGSISQRVALPEDAPGKFLLFIAWAASERVEADITDRPYLWGRMTGGGPTRFLQGQAMRGNGTERNQRTVAWGVFPIPDGASAVMFRMGQASRRGVPHTGSAATFYEPGLFVFDTQAEAETFVKAFERGASSTAALQSAPSTFPGAEWERASSLEAFGWVPERVAALKPKVESLGSSAFMIVTRGKVVAAWGDTSRTFLSHSIRKSFMSALYGIAVADGKIEIERTIGSLGVTEKGVTLTPVELQARLVDLLKARSGVYIPAAGEVESMRVDRPKRGSHAPGTHWYYNNWDFNVLGSLYRQLTGADIFEAIDRRIAKPIGMQDYRVADGQYYFEDSSAHAGYIFRISARDLARFGHLYLHKGRWRDTQVIPASWVDASVRSYSDVTGNQRSRSTRTGYGYMWWIRTNAKTRPELRIPDGTFTASGAGGQRLTVIPQIETIIVNLMNTDDETGPRIGSNEWDALLAEILAARTR